LRKSRSWKDGNAHVYMRIMVDGLSVEISTKRKFDMDYWNVASGRITGKAEPVKAFNAYLDTLQQKVFEANRQLIDRKS
jgi:Arm DNA-binding domain